MTVVEGENPAAAGEWPDGQGPLRADGPTEAETLIVDVAGFEGPLDLLLELARHHKIDLSRISMLALAEQYLAFIEGARRLQLELAADYLVMAAWLSYLKSRLLMPVAPEGGEEPPEELTARLSFRLQRLQAMREASARLMARNLLGRDVFARGAPEPLVVDRQVAFADNIVDLLKAYADRRQKKMRRQSYTVRKLPTWSVQEARAALERMVGTMNDWGTLDAWLTDYLADASMRRSVKASSFTACLELARDRKSTRLNSSH